MSEKPSPLDELNSTGLFAFTRLFADLPAPDLTSIHGTWHAAFVGPAWLRWLAPRGLSLLHFGGWWGKEISSDGTGFNYFQRSGEMQHAFPMQVMITASLIDSKPCLAVHYPPDAIFPWRFVVDELRHVDEGSLLGLTIVNKPGLRTFPTPFLLTHV